MIFWEHIVGWWHQRQRKIDMEILWPICVDEAPDLESAKAVFAVHAFNDPAWQVLGEEDLRTFIDNLERPK